MWLVVGLGNPGVPYEGTRHNVGFLVVDEVARRWSAPLSRSQLGASVGRGELARAPVLLAQPQSFMNRSGGPAGALQRFYRVPTERVVVVHDDLDLPLGAVRIKRGGGHGGHNGLRDLLTEIEGDFLRVRVGVSRPPEGMDSAAYVLDRWSEPELEQLPRMVERAADAVEAIVTVGATRAMNAFNVRPRPARSRADETEAQASAIDASSPADASQGAPEAASNTAPDGARS